MKFVEDNHLLPDGQFAYRKGLGSCDALLSMITVFQDCLDKDSECVAVSLDFSAAFDRVNHKALLYKLQLIGIGGPFLKIIENFVSSRVQCVKMDGLSGSFSDLVSGVPQGSVLGPILFILFTSDMFNVVQNSLIAYADDTTLFAPISSPGDRISVNESLNSDLLNIYEWCSFWGMKLNPKKTQTIYFSRSRTPFPAYPPLIINDETLKVSTQMCMLGVIMDNKLSFEPHIRFLASSISRKIGLLRKSNKIFHSSSINRRCFFSFLLPIFEYCSPVWMSAAKCHRDLLDRCIAHIKILIPDLEIDLGHRRSVASGCMFFKILQNPNHPVYRLLPNDYISSRNTRYNLSLNSRALLPVRCHTTMHQRSFLPSMVCLWNKLGSDVVECEKIQGFKAKLNRYLLSL